MIISKIVKINIERRNITYYRKMGYTLKVNTKLIVPTKQLMIGSKNKIIISCDICHKKYNVVYKDYLVSHRIHNFDTCNKCKFEKSKITNNEKYGCDTPLQNDTILEKYFKTNNEKYGGNSSSCSQIILDKQRKTRVENGIEIPTDKSLSDFKKYSNRTRNLTKKNKKELINNWDGKDFYDGEYIKDNFNLKFYDRLYPTIEHKITVYHGFLNNIPETEIAKLFNLAITKRFINSSRGNKDFDLFRHTF